jgi:hypothetical protein
MNTTFWLQRQKHFLTRRLKIKATTKSLKFHYAKISASQKQKTATMTEETPKASDDGFREQRRRKRNSSSNTDTQQRDKKKAAENITECEEGSDYTELLRTTENPANGGGRK